CRNHGTTSPPVIIKVVRTAPILLLLFSLTACNRSAQNKEAVRQGVMDYLNTKYRAGGDLNVAGMDITVTSVQFNGNAAEASVSFAPKGLGPSAGMVMEYQLRQAWRE